MINISKIESRSLVDGPGERTVVFLQGCPIMCPGCQSKHLWPNTGGMLVEVDEMARSLVEQNTQITISGGEPFYQPAALAELVGMIYYYAGQAGKAEQVHLLVYTGYTWEQLSDPAHPAYPWLKTILQYIDVLVDGPFIPSLDDDQITWRGSRNQRVIDVWETLGAGRLVTLDWDNEIVLDASGDLVLPVGLAHEFSGIGSIEQSRRCGESQ